jgi:hypothetical protein
MAICRASLDLGSYAALEERAEALSIASGNNHASCSGRGSNVRNADR